MIFANRNNTQQIIIATAILILAAVLVIKFNGSLPFLGKHSSETVIDISNNVVNNQDVREMSEVFREVMSNNINPEEPIHRIIKTK